MRVNLFATAVVIAVRTAGSPAEHNVLSALAPHMPTTHTSVSAATYVQPPVSSSISDGLELRQATVVTPTAASPTEDVYVAHAVTTAAAVAPADPPAASLPEIEPRLAPAAAAVPPGDGAIQPVPPAAMPDALVSATTTVPSLSLSTGDDFVTTQWVETHIGKATRWVPEIVTFHFESMSQAPLPGEGSIGMGTLTGEPGQTKTYWTVVTAAATHAVDSKPAVVAAAVAIGVVVFVM